MNGGMRKLSYGGLARSLDVPLQLPRRCCYSSPFWLLLVAMAVGFRHLSRPPPSHPIHRFDPESEFVRIAS